MRHGEEVGAFQRLPPRDVFAHEAYDFTAWLEENIGVVSDALDVTLTAVERQLIEGGQVDMAVSEDFPEW